MANGFSKEEIVAFEDSLEGFNDALVLSRKVSKYTTDSMQMERTGDIIWRPQPYIAQSYDGTDATNNFKRKTQLSVPATLGYQKHAPLILTAKELRDQLQEERFGRAAMQKLASDINIALMNVASNQGTLVVTRTTAASGYNDIAQCEAIMNEQGVQMFDRYCALSTRDYNGLAADLAGRGTMNQKPTSAYEKGYVGTVSSFETYKLDYANRITAAAGACVIDTQAAAGNYWTPQATSTSATGERSNVDNRYQTITVDTTANVAAGDCFTIAGVEAVHHVTKQGTGRDKTFRVISVPSGTTLVISPPIISAQGGTDAELQYQNCIVTANATASFTFLNTDAVAINPFWQRDALEILPGRYEVPTNAGVAVMRATTDQGIDVVMQKGYDIDTMDIKYRWDILFGVANKQPEMSGILLFSQNA